MFNFFFSQKGVYPLLTPLNPEKAAAFSAIKGRAALFLLLAPKRRKPCGLLVSAFAHHEAGANLL